MRASGWMVCVVMGLCLAGCAESHDVHGGGNQNETMPGDDGGSYADAGAADGGTFDSNGDSGVAACPSHGVSALRLWSDAPTDGCPSGFGWWLDPEATSIVPPNCEALEETCDSATWVCDGPNQAPPGSTAEMRLSLDGVAELRMRDGDGVEYCHGTYNLTVERGGSGAAAGGAWWSGPIEPET